jgi:hypothetical protein
VERQVSEYTDSISDPSSIPDSEPEGLGRSKWQRALLVLLFAVIYQISEVVFGAVVLFQVVCLLLTGDRNNRLNEFSTLLTHYMYLVLQYVCLNSSTTPWPLDKPENKTGIILD